MYACMCEGVRNLVLRAGSKICASLCIRACSRACVFVSNSLTTSPLTTPLRPPPLPPFYTIALTLLFVDTSIYKNPRAPLFTATWSLSSPTLRHPSPGPIAHRTIFRIMRQAFTLHSTGRPLYANLTNPYAPIDVWMVAAGTLLTMLLVMVVGVLLPLTSPLFRVVPASVLKTLMRGGIGWTLVRARNVPAGRDMLLGWLVAMAVWLL